MMENILIMLIVIPIVVMLLVGVLEFLIEHYYWL